MTGSRLFIGRGSRLKNVVILFILVNLVAGFAYIHHLIETKNRNSTEDLSFAKRSHGAENGFINGLWVQRRSHVAHYPKNHHSVHHETHITHYGSHKTYHRSHKTHHGSQKTRHEIRKTPHRNHHGYHHRHHMHHDHARHSHVGHHGHSSLRNHRVKQRPLYVRDDEKEYWMENGEDKETRNLTTAMSISLSDVMFDDVAAENPYLEIGGYFKPNTKPRGKLAVIIPFRNRKFHLRVFLHYLHPVLQSQRFEYCIYVINQSNKGVFNKGALMNVGYLEAMKRHNYSCYVFHDVDLLPEEHRCLYTCSDDVRHISTGISKFKYKLVGGVTVGGVSAFTPDQLQRVNGWSNRYVGWGGEDDDMAIRIRAHGMKIRRPSPSLCKFTSLPHGPDPGNPLNKKRFNLLRHTTKEMFGDGLNSVEYSVLGETLQATFTNITVELGK